VDPDVTAVKACGERRRSIQSRKRDETEFGQFIPVNHKVGQVVLVPKIGTLRIDFEGEEYYITQDREILAVINESENE